ETSLIQTIGRAARNVRGRVILYADQMTGSLTNAIRETNRRRAIQIAYNEEHGITPQTIQKSIKDITDTLKKEEANAVETLLAIDMARADTPKALRTIIQGKREQMSDAVEELDFETAAILRDEIKRLEEKLPLPPKRRGRPNVKRVYLDED
ncbi:MAG: UvrB/UvrC motif-containing protein, partial [Patescibacteria group bacterium]|nr:UvrB/UvrC motif-containing protein [Patescibacteria group bacterium]